ncbi:24483_t:CDS:1 [Racocetra persica]|uniref:24483_t:CDS:1 n=1 Tax=Racocetra persica TaxID=160502 RepID=A0ACA9KEP7_9GLOM|nr:24483_t:CDS:1 [Racocetra persica]
MESSQEISNEFAEINVPYPCSIDPMDFLSRKCKRGKKPSKSSNAFMIYRKMFSKELRKKNHKIPQSKISGMASASWKNESKDIKDAYHKLAEDVDRLFLESHNDNSVENPIEPVNANSEGIESSSLIPNPQNIDISADNILEHNLYINAQILPYYWPVSEYQFTYDVASMTYCITSIYDN